METQKNEGPQGGGANSQPGNSNTTANANAINQTPSGKATPTTSAASPPQAPQSGTSWWEENKSWVIPMACVAGGFAAGYYFNHQNTKGQIEDLQRKVDKLEEENKRIRKQLDGDWEAKPPKELNGYEERKSQKRIAFLH